MDHQYTNQIEEKPKITELSSTRTRWFTGFEKQELYKIMENYKDVFNNEGTLEQPSRKTKQETWDEITEELNRRCGLNRTAAQVSLYYKNLKQRAKQRLEKTISREIKILPKTSKPDFIYVSADPDIITVDPVSSTVITDQHEIEIKKKTIELLDIDIIHKRKLMKLEIECAEKKKQLLDLDIALKRKQLENS